MDDYEQLLKLGKHIRTLKGIESLISWDQETYMPPDGAGIRAEQIEALSGIIHREMTGKKFSNALSKLIDLKTGKVVAKGLNDEKKAALREWHRDYVKATALPSEFVEQYAKLTSESVGVWQKAKKENNFALFLPYLEKIISMCRKKAEYLGYKGHPYDALLDEFEPGMTKKEVEAQFTPLKENLVSLLKQIQGAKQVNHAILEGTFTEKKQLAFTDLIMKEIGFEKNNGRLDISSHPFSSSCHPSDNRITTRIDPNDLISNIRSVTHECGHAFYEMGLPPEQYGSPLGDAISLGIHESQSRWWETRITLSKPFWKRFLPKLKEHFKGKLTTANLNTFYRAINRVEPSLTRVEADEVTYCLHVILRFELEVALIEGSLEAKDIPEAWNKKMQELVGVTPKTDSKGCLQDIHWAFGTFGYFPTYALGNLYAAHFFEAFEEQFPDWEKRVEKGEFSFMREWLTENIHKHGRRYTGMQLLKKVTGKPFTPDAYNNYLKKKYSEIYSLSKFT